ncbi:MAG: hypothetical protein M1819_002282 [Sarea resinae]|nr:MAG: hypothetical protein M1819_002282 [Sarea resinae]
MADPEDTPSFRLGRPPAFLPMVDEVVATRGHHLPSIIHNRSSASLYDMRSQTPRRAGSVHNGSLWDEESEGDFWRTDSGPKDEQRRMSLGMQALLAPQMRSMRLIGNSNPRYQWEQYLKSEEELKDMKTSIRKYYERNNFLVRQYMYIDRLLDSSLPHNLIQEYNQPSVDVPNTISEESAASSEDEDVFRKASKASGNGPVKIKRTPKALYTVPSDEETPLLDGAPDDVVAAHQKHDHGDRDVVESSDTVVTVAIYINLVANAVLLAGKLAVIILTSSLSVLASLVDAALDFLSTAVVWTTTRMIARKDQYAYPVGRRRLEPIGVLVFSVIMITSFFQVLLECLNRLTSGDHSIVELTLPAIVIMAATVVIKFACWLWCRLINNSSVQALAQDAMTDVVFNIFSIIFPLVGFYAKIWWLDALGGMLLSLYVIINWSRTSAAHIRNLTGAASTPDERNVLLYLTMRFAKTIKQIQGIQAYHAGDKLNVEVDVVLDEFTSLRDSHDLGESLQYLLESVPTVDRAFVHLDYAGWNIPSHMSQQD